MAPIEVGFRGVLAYSLPKANYLARHGVDDVLVAYPTPTGALTELAATRCSAPP